MTKNETFQKLIKKAVGYQPGLALLPEFFQHSMVEKRWNEAPASSAVRFHHAYRGGLQEHTIDVIETMMVLVEEMIIPGKVDEPVANYGDVIAAGALHDVYKIGDASGIPYYTDNVLKGNKPSDKVPFVTSAAVLQDLLAHEAESDGAVVTWAEDAVRAHRFCRRQARFLSSIVEEYVGAGELSLSLIYALHPRLFEALPEGVKFAIRFHDGAYGRGRRMLVNNETPLQMLLHFADMWSSKAGHKPE